MIFRIKEKSESSRTEFLLCSKLYNVTSLSQCSKLSIVIFTRVLGKLKKIEWKFLKIYAIIFMSLLIDHVFA